MSPDQSTELVAQAVYTIIKILLVMVVPSLILGLIIAVFQAATSINEQTLSFLPRLIVTLLALMYGGHWMTQTLMDYTTGLFLSIPTVVS